MKVFSTSVIPAPPSKKSIVLSGANDLSSYSFYRKGSVGEFITFFSRTIAEHRANGRASRRITTPPAYTIEKYPVRPASSLLSKLLDNFTAKVSQPSLSDSSSISFPDINIFLQDPRPADTIMRVRQELDETKIVFVFSRNMQHKSIESVLQRGEKLDNLVDRSSALSAQSKMFKTKKAEELLRHHVKV
ncbi:snare protein YKT6 [Armillaria luteobubalina]|uniref:Snare protein YKT6 n=1 Tax=Armillaria luteobubalina TaxID=153913 RepID=A0AA39PSG1_9AGAR|nr:snare protein YKT6 [Armillaria luteobubalina]